MNFYKSKIHSAALYARKRVGERKFYFRREWIIFLREHSKTSDFPAHFFSSLSAFYRRGISIFLTGLKRDFIFLEKSYIQSCEKQRDCEKTALRKLRPLQMPVFSILSLELALNAFCPRKLFTSLFSWLIHVRHDTQNATLAGVSLSLSENYACVGVIYRRF
jgi:hypothetical protein